MGRILCLLMAAGLLAAGCEKKNPNYDPPAPYDGKPAKHHKFDGGATDPHSQEKEGEGGGGEGGG